ncbi:DUF4190 domain-containing protein [Microbacterium sp. SD291]|uniref:DUF4190 domain-containing protein n=1 Tax=Microbacterium sp. SD291 TaxID=2782007 RepID=UPI001A9640F0|nr:DUF4190 domain-containing protein [Microbacterium sp. SD291]
MSDSSIPTPAGDPQPTPPPVAPAAQPVQAYPGAAPAYPGAQPPAYGAQPPAYAAPAPPQGYYGAAAPVQQQAPGYPAYGAPAYPAPRPSSGLAITSLICGIGGVVLSWAIVPILASIVAVITGHMVLRQTKANPALGGRGMAFAGLILGYVMVAVILIGIVTMVISFVFLGAFTLPFIFSS